MWSLRLGMLDGEMFALMDSAGESLFAMTFEGLHDVVDLVSTVEGDDAPDESVDGWNYLDVYAEVITELLVRGTHSVDLLTCLVSE